MPGLSMGSDEAALIQLWREKRGEAAPEDLSSNLIVQLGLATEELNRSWYERNTGRLVKHVQRRVGHSAIPWMAATLDGIVEGTEAVFEAKFMLPWSFSEEAAAEKYMAQLQHNMWVTHLRTSVLSIITGGGKWVEITIPMDPLYLSVLVSAEKWPTATSRTGRPGERERSFRYARLSGGLDIVRKTLGQHEIASLQTTAIDQTAGMVNLTTTLAHASGEWIASDWPVCPIAETANPQRMGAALTYARRYALFTLVGIAGEDDLDAPDLCDGPVSLLPSAVDRSFKLKDGQSRVPPRTPGNGHGRGGCKGEVPVTLDPEQSVAVRERLLTEVGNINSANLAAAWAHQALTVKNNLTASHAKLVEDAF